MRIGGDDISELEYEFSGGDMKHSELIERLKNDSYAMHSDDDKWVEIDGDSYPYNSMIRAAQAIDDLLKQRDTLKAALEDIEQAHSLAHAYEIARKAVEG